MNATEIMNYIADGIMLVLGIGMIIILFLIIISYSRDVFRKRV